MTYSPNYIQKNGSLVSGASLKLDFGSTLDVIIDNGVTKIELANSNSNVGMYGNSSTIPIITVNEKGLVTAVSTTNITGGNSVKYFYGISTVVTSLANSTNFTVIPINTEIRKDTATFTHSSGSSNITVLSTGWYKISAEVSVTATTGSSRGSIAIYKNGTQLTEGLSYLTPINSSYPASTIVSTLVNLTANDIISFRGRTLNGGISTVANYCRFFLETIS
jgi:hypothetical protein